MLARVVAVEAWRACDVELPDGGFWALEVASMGFTSGGVTPRSEILALSQFGRQWFAKHFLIDTRLAAVKPAQIRR
jgi:hypothetical protein